jgi:hypothetical protein
MTDHEDRHSGESGNQDPSVEGFQRARVLSNAAPDSRFRGKDDALVGFAGDVQTIAAKFALPRK